MESPKTVQKSFTDVTKDRYRVKGDQDLRTLETDVFIMDKLEKAYSKEFAAAEEKMKLKNANKSLLKETVLYDYDSDKRYRQWEDDQKAVRERLQIHWIDEMIDKPGVSMTYLLRVGTSIGLCFGIYKSVQLWRTVDRTYTRMSGGSLTSSIVNEISVAILKGAGCSIAGVAGITIGDGACRLGASLLSNDAYAPKREWTHVVASFSVGGLFWGSALAAMHFALLSQKGMAMVACSCTLLGLSSGLYFGYALYKPFAAGRHHRIDDPYWRPWHQRMLTKDGSRQVRGRYV